MEKIQHKIDKTQISFCNIICVGIATVHMEWLLDFTDKHIKELYEDYMCISCVYYRNIV